MFRNKSKKLISKDLISVVRPGIKDEKVKKLIGVMANASMDVIAVSVTDSATCPPANIEKKLEALPPGQAATNNIPKAIPGGGVITTISNKVTIGKIIYCENKPVATLFFSWRN
jgi:hypothetical protein